MSAPRKSSGRRTAYVAAPPAIAPAPAPPQADALGPLRAVVRRWPIVVAVTVVALAAALAAGRAQSPTYTASADVNVGRVDVRVQTLPGYVAGAQALAAAYSRIATSDSVVVPLARRVRASPAEIRSRISATPVPDSTIFRIYATGPSEREAIALARAAAAQMEAYVAASDDGEQALDDVLGGYREQSRLAAGYRQRLERLERLRDQQAAAPSAIATATATPSRRTRERRAAEIQRLQVALDTAQLRMQTLGSRYQERGNELAATAGIQVITRPTTAVSDRDQTLQRLATIGLIAGLLLGVALALAVDRRASA